jgi:hypothetical protein
VLAPASSLRPYIVPEDKSEIEPAHPDCSAKAEISTKEEAETKPKRGKRPKNYSWAQLLRRVFLVDVLICPHCGGCLRILCAIVPPDAIAKILVCLGRPPKPPPIFPANPDRDPEFFLNEPIFLTSHCGSLGEALSFPFLFLAFSD